MRTRFLLDGDDLGGDSVALRGGRAPEPLTEPMSTGIYWILSASTRS
jgi:hypothetical protein